MDNYTQLHAERVWEYRSSEVTKVSKTDLYQHFVFNTYIKAYFIDHVGSFFNQL